MSASFLYILYNLYCMRVVVQRVASASVSIGGQMKSSIGKGLMILLGVGQDDEKSDADKLAKKIAALRIFDDAEGVMNCSVKDVSGELLVVSQFTLMASTRKGNRPSYVAAAGHEKAIPLYEYFCQVLAECVGCDVQTGEFGANMQVSLVNDGPVTIYMDTK